MGGGLWTGMAIPLIASYGPGNILIITLIAILFWLAVIFLPRIRAKITQNS
jgi:hypothetical protein